MDLNNLLTLAFETIMKMSVTGSIIALVVIVLRLFKSKLPKGIFLILWAVVFIKLVLPFEIPSPTSLWNKVSMNDLVSPIYTGDDLYSAPIPNPIADIVGKPDTAVPKSLSGYKPVVNVPKTMVAAVYFSVSLLSVIALIFLYFLTKSKLKTAIKAEHDGNLFYRSPQSNSPFVFGIIKPKIILPCDFDLSDTKTLGHILAHEKQHIKHLDHLWNLLSLFVVCLHWFNPVIWVARILLNKDIESYCDYKVIKTIGEEHKGEYASSLLRCSVRNQKLTPALVVGFGESDVKTRIKGIAKYKKSGIVAGIVTAVLIIGVISIFAFGAYTNSLERYVKQTVKNGNITEIRALTDTGNLTATLSKEQKTKLTNILNPSDWKKAPQSNFGIKYEVWFDDLSMWLYVGEDKGKTILQGMKKADYKKYRKPAQCYIADIEIFNLLSTFTYIKLSKQDEVPQTQSKFILHEYNGTTDTALEPIAEDSHYTYHLSTIRSDKIMLEFPNGEKISLKEALKQKRVTIEEAIHAGLSVIMYAKSDPLFGSFAVPTNRYEFTFGERSFSPSLTFLYLNNERAFFEANELIVILVGFGEASEKLQQAIRKAEYVTIGGKRYILEHDLRKIGIDVLLSIDSADGKHVVSLHLSDREDSNEQAMQEFVSALKERNYDMINQIYGVNNYFDGMRFSNISYKKRSFDGYTSYYQLDFDFSGTKPSKLSNGKNQCIAVVDIHPMGSEEPLVLKLIPRLEFESQVKITEDPTVKQIYDLRSLLGTTLFDKTEKIPIEHLAQVITYYATSKTKQDMIPKKVFDTFAKQYFGLENLDATSTVNYNSEEKMYFHMGMGGLDTNDRYISITRDKAYAYVVLENYKDPLQLFVQNTIQYTLKQNIDGTYQFVSAKGIASAK